MLLCLCVEICVLHKALTCHQDIDSWNVSNSKDFVSLSMELSKTINSPTQVTHSLLSCFVEIHIQRCIDQDTGDWDVSKGKDFVSIAVDINISTPKSV